jgi:hypothetical protein
MKVLWVASVAILLIVGAAGAVWALSGAHLETDVSALGRVELQPFAGSLVSVRARTADGRSVPLLVSHGRVTPRVKVASGEQIVLSVVVRRPGWESWALGSVRHETLTVQTPAATIVNRWITVARGARAKVRFTTSVGRVSVAGGAVAAGRTVILPTKTAAGSVAVAAAARPWEKLGAPIEVSWFPQSQLPVVLVSPAPGAQADPLTPIRLTFSSPVARVLGDAKPQLVPAVTGSWSTLDAHTLVFQPTGSGAPFDSQLAVRFPSRLVVAGANGAGERTTTSVGISIAPASFLRLQQLLAEEGYLPLVWQPSGPNLPHTMRSEVAAAVTPPDGHFQWGYPNTPHELQGLWKAGAPNDITRGAVMMFEDEHHLTVDGLVGPRVWRELIADAVAGNRRSGGYSYVFVHRNVPQLMTLWHNGHVVLTSPGNTGVPAAPTALGTWPVFEHIPVGRMSGRNPDGSHYNDPGIRWISYFHGGEALHAFNRASFGTPQSLGCVELPLDAAAKVWPYTPIGTLVTIEN